MGQPLSLQSPRLERGCGNHRKKKDTFYLVLLLPHFYFIFLYTVLNFGSWKHWGERSVQKLQEQKTMKRKGQNIANVGKNIANLKKQDLVNGKCEICLQ